VYHRRRRVQFRLVDLSHKPNNDTIADVPRSGNPMMDTSFPSTIAMSPPTFPRHRP
jgi:hypothetical protein